jgi:uncharacterized membrane protein (TIGR02234 family)
VAGGLLAAVAVAVGMSRPWFTATATVDGLPRIEVSVTGAELASLAGALGLVLLASFGAVLATGTRIRQAVGLVIVAGAVVVLAAAVHPSNQGSLLQERLAARGWSAGSGYSTTTEGWRWLVLVGAVGCLVAGGLVVRRGSTWPTMAKRYDAPRVGEATAAARPEQATAALQGPAPETALDDEAVWRALDEGHDPTREP